MFSLVLLPYLCSTTTFRRTCILLCSDIYPVLWLFREQLHLRKGNAAVQWLCEYTMMDNTRGSACSCSAQYQVTENPAAVKTFSFLFSSFFFCFSTFYLEVLAMDTSLSRLFKARYSTVTYKYCHHIFFSFHQFMFLYKPRMLLFFYGPYSTITFP